MELSKHFEVNFDTDPTYLSGILSYECKEVIDSIHAHYNIYPHFGWTELVNSWARDYPDISRETIVELLDNRAAYGMMYTSFLLAHPNCPETAKIWLKNGGFAGLTLKEFMEKVEN